MRSPRGIRSLFLAGTLVVTLTGLVSVETVKQQLEEHLSERQRKWLAPNYTALDKGAALVEAPVA